jgi:hypothetical protein
LCKAQKKCKKLILKTKKQGALPEQTFHLQSCVFSSFQFQVKTIIYYVTIASFQILFYSKFLMFRAQNSVTSGLRWTHTRRFGKDSAIICRLFFKCVFCKFWVNFLEQNSLDIYSALCNCLNFAFFLILKSEPKIFGQIFI